MHLKVHVGWSRGGREVWPKEAIAPSSHCSRPHWKGKQGSLTNSPLQVLGVLGIRGAEEPSSFSIHTGKEYNSGITLLLYKDILEIIP